MGMPFDWNVLINAVKKKKQEQKMQDMITNARMQGADIDMVYDANTESFVPHIKYKSKSKDELLKERFEVEKMINEMTKWRQEQETWEQRQETWEQKQEDISQKRTKAREFSQMADVAFGGGLKQPVASAMGRPVAFGETMQAEPYLDWIEQFKQANQTLVPSEKGWSRVSLPKEKSIFTQAKIQSTLGELEAGGAKDILGQVIPFRKKDDAIKHVLRKLGPRWKEIAPEAEEIINKHWGNGRDTTQALSQYFGNNKKDTTQTNIGDINW